MGAFSSNDRMDFRAVLQSFSDTEISMPSTGGWANAGMVRGGKTDLCWRLMDAQYWGKPRLVQRRKRIFLVADFRGQRSAEILFKPPKCSMSGKWRFVMAIGDFSISLAQTGIIPLREAARGNTPIPSNRLPNLRAHIDRLSFCFFMCCFHFSAPFQTIKKHHQWKSIQWRLLLSAHFSR